MRSFNGVALFNKDIITEQDCPNIISVEVHDHTDNIMREKEKFAEHGVPQTINHGDAIADTYDRADIIAFHLPFKTFDLLFDKGTHFCGSVFHSFSPPLNSFARKASSLLATDPSKTFPST